MTPTQLRQITSYLARPASMYPPYNMICKNCNVCADARPIPSRAHINGMIADKFGDRCVTDHNEIRYNGAIYRVSLVLGVASSRRSAYPQSTLETVGTLDNIRKCKDDMAYKPQPIVAGMCLAPTMAQPSRDRCEVIQDHALDSSRWHRQRATIEEANIHTIVSSVRVGQ